MSQRWSVEQCEARLNACQRDDPQRGAALLAAGRTYSSRYSRTRDEEDLGRGIGYLEEAIECGSEDPHQQAAALFLLGKSYVQRYLIQDTPEDLDEGIDLMSEAVDLTPDGAPELLLRLDDLFAACEQRYADDSEVFDLEMAIDYCQRRVNLTPDSATKAARQCTLGLLYRKKSEATKDSADLEAGIQHFSHGLQGFQPDQQVPRDKGFAMLGTWYMDLYRLIGDMANVEKSRANFAEAVSLAEDAGRPAYVARVGDACYIKFFITGDILHLDECLARYEEAKMLSKGPDDSLSLLEENLYGHVYRLSKDDFELLKQTRAGGSDMPTVEGAIPGTFLHGPRPRDLAILNTPGPTEKLGAWIRQLHQVLRLVQLRESPGDMREKVLYSVHLEMARSYQMRFLVSQRMAYIDLALEYLKTASELSPSPTPSVVERLKAMAICFEIKYHSTRDFKDLLNALRCHEDALRGTPVSHLDRCESLLSIAHCLNAKHQISRDKQDLELAIQQMKELADGLSDDDSIHAESLSFLAHLHLKRYRYDGLGEDIDTAIGMIQILLDSVPKGSPKRHLLLFALGAAHNKQHFHTGSAASLDSAMGLLHEALDTAPADPSLRLPIMGELSYAYSYRYQARGANEDLQMAIGQMEEVVHAIPKSDADWSEHFRRLGHIHLVRYERNHEIADLDRAIQLCRDALGNMREQDHARPMLLGDLGVILGMRYQQSNDDQFMSEAVEHLQEGVKTAPENDADWRYCLGSLGNVYAWKYQETSDLQDLELSIFHLEKSFETAHEESSSRWATQYMLGMCYKNKASETGQAENLGIALEHFRDVIDNRSCLPWARIDTCKEMLPILAEAKEWEDAYETCSKALSVALLLAPRSLEISDKQLALIRATGLASDAAAIALMSGKVPYEAIRFLESGRGLIMSSLGETRSDMLELEQQHPGLAKEFAENRDMLQAGVLVDSNLTTVLKLDEPRFRADQRYNAEREMNRVIETVRALPGFSDFLLPPSAAEIQAAVGSIPTVVINASRYRCDAIVVQKEGFEVISLPSLKLKDIEHFEDALRSKQGFSDTSLLEWLWDSIAEPVLSKMGFSKTLSSGWPHVRWVAIGSLSKFPIHAAGYHHLDESSVLDRVISSYGLSLRGLVGSQSSATANRDATRASQKQDVLLVGSPGNLAFVDKEIMQLTRLWTNKCRSLTLPRPDQGEVLAALRNCDIFHFAGHGHANSFDPSASGLVLQRGERLTVSSLLDINLQSRKPKPFLAYLSACGTGRMKHDGLIDENLHLIAAFRLAGFQNVVGTLWDVDDQACVHMATITYKWIQSHGMSNESVSEGLHNACRALRADWVAESRARLRTSRALNSERVQPKAAGSTGSSLRAHMRDLMGVDELPFYWVPYVHLDG